MEQNHPHRQLYTETHHDQRCQNVDKITPKSDLKWGTGSQLFPENSPFKVTPSVAPPLHLAQQLLALLVHHPGQRPETQNPHKGLQTGQEEEHVLHAAE